MHNSVNDIPPWLARLPSQTLRRLNSRLTYLLRMVDAEMQRRDTQHHRLPMQGTYDDQSR